MKDFSSPTRPKRFDKVRGVRPILAPRQTRERRSLMLEILARALLWITAGAFGLAGLVLIGYVVLSWLGVGENEN